MVIRRYLLIGALISGLMGLQTGSAFPQGSEAPTAPENIFTRAARLYDDGRVEEAILNYQGVLEQGLESGPLYFNLGTCYLKKGNKGKAILYYEKARRYIPLDSDLRANLALARSLSTEKQTDLNSGALGHGTSRLRQLSIDHLTLMLSLFYLLLISSLICRMLFPSIKKISNIVIILACCAVLLSAWEWNRQHALSGREAVVITPKTAARAQPFDRAPIGSILPEGSAVEVLESTRDWVKIAIRGKKAGWVKTADLGVI